MKNYNISYAQNKKIINAFSIAKLLNWFTYCHFAGKAFGSEGWRRVFARDELQDCIDSLAQSWAKVKILIELFEPDKKYDEWFGKADS